MGELSGMWIIYFNKTVFFKKCPTLRVSNSVVLAPKLLKKNRFSVIQMWSLSTSFCNFSEPSTLEKLIQSATPAPFFTFATFFTLSQVDQYPYSALIPQTEWPPSPSKLISMSHLLWIWFKGRFQETFNDQPHSALFSRHMALAVFSTWICS